jgi:hypothetical protein
LIAAAVLCGAFVESAHAAPFTITPESEQVRLEMQGTVATAHRVACDPKKIVLEGSYDMPVMLTRTTNGQPLVVRASRITLSVNGGQIKIDGVRFLKK